MLKIRDDVDLKELKKFGFITYTSCDEWEIYYCICNLFIGKDKIIRQDDGVNECKDCIHKFNDTEISILYDLIQAGLVEKVSD